MGAVKGKGLQGGIETLVLNEDREACKGSLSLGRCRKTFKRRPDCFFQLRINNNVLAGEEIAKPFKRPGDFMGLINVRQRLKAERLILAQIEKRAAKGSRRGSRRTALIEKEDLRFFIAPELHCHEA